VRTAVRAARLMGDGLYGVDLKEVEGRALVIEVNDNPNLDAGYEDGSLGDALYLAVMRYFLAAWRRRERGPTPEPPAGARGARFRAHQAGRGTPPEPLGLFQGFGVEIEWMIVDAESLDVRPSGDAVLGEDGEVDRGRMAWSNELVLHVLEVKTNGPAASLDGLAGPFHAEALEAEAAGPLGCRLLSGAAHPWMDPDRETRIWPHEYTEVYRAFDRIFGVRGHGWANLQSTRI
jgi:hypothetical protein